MNKGFVTALLIFLTPILVITLSTVWYYSGYGPEEKVKAVQVRKAMNKAEWQSRYERFTETQESFLQKV